MLNDFSYEDLVFNDNRGKLPEDVKARAPLGTRARIKRAAENEGVSHGEIIRRALMAYLGGQSDPLGPHGARA